MVEAWIARSHLANCRYCGRRRWSLEGPRAERMIELYDTVTIQPEEDPAHAATMRAEFAQWLRFEARRVEMESRRERPATLRKMRPALSGVSLGLFAGLATSAIAFTVAWHRVPKISANNLLVHAERWDPGAGTRSPAVAHQTVRIKTPRQILERSLYWDLQGKRRPKRKALGAGEEQLRLELGRAGVDWDLPISASAYQDWHDHQHIRADRIAWTGSHLLTLTTTVPEGIVSRESITVRDTDFHPVQRTIDFRDSDTVEIAELDYTVLPWSAVDAGAFEPAASVPMGVARVEPHSALSLQSPEVPTAAQLDETELTARLILNQLHADDGEQINVRRSGQGVEVEGLVSSEDRKREITTRLMTVPRLKVRIRSETELSESPLKAEAVTVESAALPDNPSALEAYMRRRGHPIDEINSMERQLFDGALLISTEIRSIVDLEARYAHPGQMRMILQATLAELLYSHHERLRAAIRQEQATLARAEGAQPSKAGPLEVGPLPLTDAAEEYLALVKELTQTNAAPARDAEQIFADMTGTLDQLLFAERNAHAGREVDAAAGTSE